MPNALTSKLLFASVKAIENITENLCVDALTQQHAVEFKTTLTSLNNSFVNLNLSNDLLDEQINLELYHYQLINELFDLHEEVVNKRLLTPANELLKNHLNEIPQVLDYSDRVLNQTRKIINEMLSDCDISLKDVYRKIIKNIVNILKVSVRDTYNLINKELEKQKLKSNSTKSILENLSASSNMQTNLIIARLAAPNINRNAEQKPVMSSSIGTDTNEDNVHSDLNPFNIDIQNSRLSDDDEESFAPQSSTINASSTSPIINSANYNANLPDYESSDDEIQSDSEPPTLDLDATDSSRIGPYSFEEAQPNPPRNSPRLP